MTLRAAPRKRRAPQCAARHFSRSLASPATSGNRAVIAVTLRRPETTPTARPSSNITPAAAAATVIVVVVAAVAAAAWRRWCWWCWWCWRWGRGWPGGGSVAAAACAARHRSRNNGHEVEATLRVVGGAVGWVWDKGAYDLGSKRRDVEAGFNVSGRVQGPLVQDEAWAITRAVI